MNKVMTTEFKGWTDDNVCIETGLVYSNRRNQRLKMHLVYPASFYFEKRWGFKIEKKYPAIVFVAGSGFTHPVYKGRIGIVCRMAAAGFVVAMVEYSNFLKGNSFLDTCMDVKTAIRFLRSKAEEYHIDTDRIAAWGTSSGATDVQYAAFTGGEESLKTGEYKEFDDSVGALVSICGPSDMVDLVFTPGHPETRIYEKYWDEHPPKKDRKELCTEASTINLVGNRPIPPVMLAHGTSDDLVPFSHSENMYRKLTEYGHDVVFYKVKGAGHNTVMTPEIIDAGLAFIKDVFDRQGN